MYLSNGIAKWSNSYRWSFTIYQDLICWLDKSWNLYRCVGKTTTTPWDNQSETVSQWVSWTVWVFYIMEKKDGMLDQEETSQTDLRIKLKTVDLYHHQVVGLCTAKGGRGWSKWMGANKDGELMCIRRVVLFLQYTNPCIQSCLPLCCAWI